MALTTYTISPTNLNVGSVSPWTWTSTNRTLVAGDAIVLCMQLLYGSNILNTEITSIQDDDTVNTAPYAMLRKEITSWPLGGNYFHQWMYWKVSSGSYARAAPDNVRPVITFNVAVNPGGFNGTGFQVTGFAGAATASTEYSGTYYHAGDGTTNWYCPPDYPTRSLVNAHNNEALFNHYYANTGNYTTAPTNWTCSSSYWIARRVVAAASTDVSFGPGSPNGAAGVWNTANVDMVQMIGGIYDAAVSADPVTIVGRRKRGMLGPQGGFGRMFRRRESGLLVPDWEIARG